MDERFWRRTIATPSGCREWQGARYPSGYGHLRRSVQGKGVDWLAHRYAWQLTHGSLPPKGTELDHLCRNRLCVNPDHLEVVTHRENGRRGVFPNALKTHCANGHEYTPENTRWVKVRGEVRQRQCKTCRRAYVSDLRKRRWVMDPEWAERTRERNRRNYALRAQDPGWRAKENARTLDAYHRSKNAG